MKRTLIACAVISIALCGCAELDKNVVPKVAAAVMTYCATPQAERQLIRESVNTRIQPNAIKVTCVGDAP